MPKTHQNKPVCRIHSKFGRCGINFRGGYSPLDYPTEIMADKKSTMTIKKAIRKLLDKVHKPKIGVSIFCILILEIIIASVIYLTGGTQFAFTHLMYIPIIMSAFFYDIWGGAGAAILGGIILGPFMPVDVYQELMQEPLSWIFRTVIFIIIGSFIGLLFRRIKLDKEIQINKSYLNEITGLPNGNKFRKELNKLINEQKDFSVILFKITNIDDINIYVDYTIGEKSLFKMIEIFKKYIDAKNLYSVFTNEFAVVLKGFTIEKAYSKAEKFLHYFDKPIFIEGFPVSLVIKCGIINYPLHGKETNDLFKKMNRTLEQNGLEEHKIAIYEDSIAQKNKAKYNMVISLYEVMKNNEFLIEYQPIISLNDNKIKGVEALLRWNNPKYMKPGEFIKIAEGAGIISDITKWVIKNVIDQIHKWQEIGIKTKVAINISSKDLKDDSIITYTKDCIEGSQIEPDLLEFELTERVIIENENEVEDLLSRIKNMGIKISIDDFGTGYNSLIQLFKLPIDNLKIDKFFIDHIEDVNHRSLIKETIKLAHNLGMGVIAEGVETEKQLGFLNSVGCDNIQGYYFSKPLPPDEFTAFFLKSI